MNYTNPLQLNLIHPNLTLEQYRFLAATIQPSKAISYKRINYLADVLGLTDILTNFVAIRNSSPSAYDCIVTFLNGAWVKSNHILYGYTGKAFNGRVAFKNSSVRDGALRRIGINSLDELETALQKVGITEDLTVDEALNNIIVEAQKADSCFAQYSPSVIQVATNLKKIL